MGFLLLLCSAGGRAGGREAATKFSSQEKEEERERVSPTPLPFPSPLPPPPHPIVGAVSTHALPFSPSFPPLHARERGEDSPMEAWVPPTGDRFKLHWRMPHREAGEGEGRKRKEEAVFETAVSSILPPLPPSCSGRLFPSPHLSAFWSGEKFADTAGRKREERRGMAEGKVAEEEAKRWGKEKGCRESLPSFLPLGRPLLLPYLPFSSQKKKLLGCPIIGQSTVSRASL